MQHHTARSHDLHLATSRQHDVLVPFCSSGKRVSTHQAKFLQGVAWSPTPGKLIKLQSESQGNTRKRNIPWIVDLPQGNLAPTTA